MTGCFSPITISDEAGAEVEEVSDEVDASVVSDVLFDDA